MMPPIYVVLIWLGISFLMFWRCEDFVAFEYEDYLRPYYE
jgi:hypothetical protein